MALTPINTRPKEKKDPWGTVATAMSLASTAVNIAGGVQNLAKTAPPPNTPTSPADMAKSPADFTVPTAPVAAAPPDPNNVSRGLLPRYAMRGRIA